MIYLQTSDPRLARAACLQFGLSYGEENGFSKIFRGPGVLLALAEEGIAPGIQAAETLVALRGPEPEDFFLCLVRDRGQGSGLAVSVSAEKEDPGCKPFYPDLFVKTELPYAEVEDNGAWGAFRVGQTAFGCERCFALAENPVSAENPEKTENTEDPENPTPSGKTENPKNGGLFLPACACFVKEAAAFFEDPKNRRQTPFVFSEEERNRLKKLTEHLKLTAASTDILCNLFWRNKLLGRDLLAETEPFLREEPKTREDRRKAWSRLLEGLK